MRYAFPFSTMVGLMALLVVVGCTDDMVAPPPPPAPVASFDWTGVTIMPAQITFQNLSQHADEFIWNFGDNTSSNDTNPTHIYAQAGLYDVTLTARARSTGASNSITLQLPVDAGPLLADFVLPAYPVTFTQLVFENTSRNAGRSRWDFGDGRISDLTRPVVNYSTYGSYTITLIAYSRDERRSDTLRKQLTVSPSQVYLDSVFVVQYPLVTPANRPWDPDGPADLFWTLQPPTGPRLRSQIRTDVTEEILLQGWRTPGSSLLLDDPNYAYLIQLYDADGIDSSLIGTVGFQRSQLPENGVYPSAKVLVNDQLRIKIGLRWL